MTQGKRRETLELTQTVMQTNRKTRSPETIVAYMKQTSSDEWNGEEMEMYRELTGDDTLQRLQARESMCNTG